MAICETGSKVSPETQSARILTSDLQPPELPETKVCGLSCPLCGNVSQRLYWANRVTFTQQIVWVQPPSGPRSRAPSKMSPILNTTIHHILKGACSQASALNKPQQERLNPREMRSQLKILQPLPQCSHPASPALCLPVPACPAPHRPQWPPESFWNTSTGPRGGPGVPEHILGRQHCWGLVRNAESQAPAQGRGPRKNLQGGAGLSPAGDRDAAQA